MGKTTLFLLKGKLNNRLLFHFCCLNLSFDFIKFYTFYRVFENPRYKFIACVCVCWREGAKSGDRKILGKGTSRVTAPIISFIYFYCNHVLWWSWPVASAIFPGFALTIKSTSSSRYIVCLFHNRGELPSRFPNHCPVGEQPMNNSKCKCRCPFRPPRPFIYLAPTGSNPRSKPPPP